MIYYNLLKIVVRSWWRNKLFFLISLGSLTVGLSCTILLATFVIHEYRIESDNPNAARIVRLMQPGIDGGFTYYAHFPSTAPLTEAFPDVESVLRTGQLFADAVTYGQEKFPAENLALADTIFLRFFPVRTLSGDLRHTLQSPDRVAVSEEFARRVFGNRNPVGETLAFHLSAYNTRSGKEETLTLSVGAVFQQREHSIVKAHLITGMEGERSSVWLLARPGTDMEAFRRQVEETPLQQLLDKGCYRTHSLSDVYFATDVSDSCRFILAHRDRTMLYAGLLSALLVLLIGIFNYVNLSFSRLLGLVKTLRIEQLMGAGKRIIRLQLFTDTLAMLLLAFLLALLLVGDLLPLFNALYHTRLTPAYFFSTEIWPVLLLSVVCFSVLPAGYLSRTMQRMRESSYRRLFTGQRKRSIVSLLVSFQFLISFILLFALATIRGQIGLVQRSADRYQGLYEVSVPDGGMRLLLHEAKGIEGVTDAVVTDDSGKEEFRMVSIMTCGKDYLPMLGVKIEQEGKGKHEQGVYVNRTFVCQIAQGDEGILGRSLGELIKDEKGYPYPIIGIVEDLPSIYGEEHAVLPGFYLVSPEVKDNSLLLRCDPQHKAELETRLKALCEKYQLSTSFRLDDLYKTVMYSNQKVFEFSRLILSYAVVSLVLIAFGLFGISWFSVRQRTREIAIRKVHGASVIQIVWLLNRPFLWQMAGACLLAVPTAWWLMQHWLEQFVRRAPVTVWGYVFPLLLVFGITFLTVTLHSYRAARSNPVHSLKTE